MGCCQVKDKTSKDTKNTLRDDDRISSLKKDGQDVELYKGIKAKDILEDHTQEDLLLAVKNGSSKVVEALCAKLGVTNVCELRGLNGDFELLGREKYNISNWNLILIAIANNHLFAAKMFTKTLKCHLRIALRSPPILGFSKMQESSPAQSESFPILLALNNRNEEMLKFLWDDLRLLWDSFHLLHILEEMSKQKYIDGISIILKSQTAHEIYLSMRTSDKIQFLTELMIQKQTKRQMDVKERLKEELTLHPYATVSLFVIMNDPKGYNINSMHLDRAYTHLDVKEYGRLKYTHPTFDEFVMKKVVSFQQQDESSSQKQFGEKLKKQLDQLDQDVVKLKYGFVSALDYDQLFTTKLFTLAESNDPTEINQVVRDNDVRLFKRQRKGVVQLTSSFSINPYSYFTPLLWAIQKGNHSVVQFIMDQMKIGLRQCLCLQPVDNEESFGDINEEYQSYGLLCAAANQDETMLRQLWQTYGTYLWSERHFEPLMRYLIESEWIDGIKLILGSDQTHQMIRALSSEERSFFIENMIGDLFSLEKLHVQTVLKEELCKKPYAGLFIVYMIDRFDNIAEDDFQYWDQACQSTSIYKAEMQLLSKSNQSRFSKFFLDYGVKKQDGNLKSQAQKFIERLKELPEYLPIIQECSEEAIQNGDEEVKFLKKDMSMCEQQWMIDIIKYTITGNLNQLKKTLESEKLSPLDIFDIRGFAVKAYDPQKTIINTREWNPVHYAIYFRQFQILKYFFEDLKINAKIATDFHHTSNEFVDETMFIDQLASHTHLYGLLLSIYTKDQVIFKYLYEECYEKYQYDETDIIRILKICIFSDWPQGFLTVIHSKVTTNVFILSSLDFKEEFIQYVIGDSVIQSDCINENKNEEIVREIKEAIVGFPYCAVSWVFVDPFKEQKNHRYIKTLQENFDQIAMDVLDQCGQLQKITQVSQKPQINLDFLDMNINDENEKKEMEEQHKYNQNLNQKFQEHLNTFIKRIDQRRPDLLKRGIHSEICTQLITEVFTNSDYGQTRMIDQITEELQKNKIRYLQFINEYYDFRFKQQHKIFEKIEIEKLNLLHWIIFFDLKEVIAYVLESQTKEQLHIGRAFSGELHQPIEFTYKDVTQNEQKLQLQNIGAILCIMQKTYGCWENLLRHKNGQGLLNSNEILEYTVLICVENWAKGLQPFVYFIESAFLKSSITKRVQFISRLIKINNECYKDVLRIEKIQTFLEWMYEIYKQEEQLDMNPQVKRLLPSTQKHKERELTKIKFLARLKPQRKDHYLGGGAGPDEKISKDNDIVNIDEIIIERGGSSKKRIRNNQDESDDGSMADIKSD